MKIEEEVETLRKMVEEIKKRLDKVEKDLDDHIKHGSHPTFL